MGLGLRLYIVNDDGSLVRIPWARYERVLKRDPKERFPQYAGQRVRCVEVVLELENRKPIAIRRIDYFLLPFDARGRVDAAEQKREMKLALNLLSLPDFPDEPRKVINASHRFAKRRLEHLFKWMPGKTIESAILEAIFD